MCEGLKLISHNENCHYKQNSPDDHVSVASVYPLPTTSGDLTPSSQRPSPCTVQTCTTLLGPGGMQGTNVLQA